MDKVQQLLNLMGVTAQPWWVYLLIALIPLCILVSIREFTCWFWKINKIVDCLERIEERLMFPEQRRPGAREEKKPEAAREFTLGGQRKDKEQDS